MFTWVYIPYLRLKGVVVLRVEQDEEVLKNIINRLNKDDGVINLYDCSDKSNITIDSKLLGIIKNYYEDLLSINNISSR